MRTAVSLTLIAISLAVAGFAQAAVLHLDDRTAPAAFERAADGSWLVHTAGATVTLTAGEAKQFADLVKPDSPEPPPPTPTHPTVTFTRVNQGNGGTGFAVSAGRDELLVLQGFWRRAEIQEARFANPNLKILIYQNISRTRNPDSLGQYPTLITTSQAQARGWSSGIADPDGGTILKPVDATGYAALACSEFKRRAGESALNGYRVDGVFLDDDTSSTFPGDAGGQSASTWDPWMESVNSQLSTCLREAGYTAMPNLSASIGEHNLSSGGWQARQLKFFPYVYAEFTAWWPGGGVQDQRFVNETFRLMGVSAGLGTVFVAGDYPSTEAKQAFSLGMCLVKAAGFCSKGTGVGNTDEWYATYDRAIALGQPVGAAVSPSAGVWTRSFQNGSVRVDLNARTATIGQ